MKKTLFFFLLLSITTIDLYAQLTIVPFNNSTPGPGLFAVFNGRLNFFAWDANNGYELWKLETTTPQFQYDINAGTADAGKYIGGATDGYRFAMPEVNGKLYFPANNGSTGLELFSWDGANAPALVSDIVPGAGDGFNIYSEMIALSNKVYFTASTSSSGLELWSHDPATNTTAMVSDINPGSADSKPQFLTVYNGKLYFAADNVNTGIELYCCDPATNNVTLVANIGFGGVHSRPTSLIVIGNKLYFTADEPTYHRELYSYDGTQAVRLTDINAGINSSFQQTLPGQNAFCFFKGAIYMGANDGVTGYNLFKYDITSQVVSNVYNISTTGAVPIDFYEYGNKLYFTADDHVVGRELWCYDGVNNPYLVYDIQSGFLSCQMNMHVVYNNELYLSTGTSAGAVAYAYLYKFRDSAFYNSVPQPKINADIKVYPNPASSVAYVELNLNNSEALSISLTDVMGRIVYATGRQQYAAGSHKLSIPFSELASGVYFYRIQGDEDIDKYGKLLKP